MKRGIETKVVTALVQRHQLKSRMPDPDDVIATGPEGLKERARRKRRLYEDMLRERGMLSRLSSAEGVED